MNKDNYDLESLISLEPDPEFDRAYDPDKYQLDETAPKYVIDNGVSRYKQMAQILAVYFHAKHGEPLPVLSVDHDSDEPIMYKL